jgi:hypothetical protein
MNADPTPRLRLLDLNALDARELERSLPNGSYQIEQEKLQRGEHGDLGATAAIVVLVSPLVIQAITAWLLKKRQKRSIVLTMEKIGPDNTTERRRLEITLSDSEAPQADVLKQIVSGMKLDPEIAKTILSGGT